MERTRFDKKLEKMFKEHRKLIQRSNKKQKKSNGIYDRYKYPVLTAEHTPLIWRYDLNYETNPHLLERLGMNTTFNAGAIELNGKYYLVVRSEGVNVKSFFAVAESPNGIDQFRFWDHPIIMPVDENDPETNVYDMRLTKHEDGWIYGLFCAERKDLSKPDDSSAAIASCGISRTRDLIEWERLDDLKSPSPQQRNCVLHPEFVNGKYAFYTRPQKGFIDTGESGIGWGLSDSIEHAEVRDEKIIDPRIYHTVKEVKNGQGPTPLKTEKGWLHLAHGVRFTAAGLRYVLYMFMTSLDDPSKVIYRPGGHFMAPQGTERVGDVSNVVFCNGWIRNEKDEVYIYYASSDTRMHVATTTMEKLLDYVMNTPEDPGRTERCAKQRDELVAKNLKILKERYPGVQF